MNPARFLAVVAVILGVAAWALVPLSPEIHRARTETPPVTATSVKPEVVLDVSAFRAPLWIAPPPPPPTTPVVTEKPEPPPPPLKLQILAIVRDGETDRALFYDPDTDKPIWVSSGQSIGTRTVEHVTAKGVEIREGKLLRTLALRTDKPPSSPLEKALRGSGDSR